MGEEMHVLKTLQVAVCVFLWCCSTKVSRAEKAGAPSFQDALLNIDTLFEATSGQSTVRHWIPSSTGSVRVVGYIRKLSSESDASFDMRIDGKTAFSRKLDTTDSICHAFDQIACDLHPQSMVDFRVTAGALPVRVHVALQVVPEPFASRWRSDLPTGFPAFSDDRKRVLRKKGQDILQAIRDASVAKAGRIVIPPGDYLFHARWSQASTLQDLIDMEIVADGVTFWFEPPHVHALLFKSCRNVTVRGLDIDFTSPIWFQARVAGIDRKTKTIHAALMKGYEPRNADGETETSGERMFIFYDADGRFINHGPSPGKWRLSADDGSILCEEIRRCGIPDALKSGGYVVGTIRTGAALRSRGCAGMRFEDTNIWSSPGIALYEGGGDGGNVYLRVRATRRPWTNRLHAFGADVFHMAATDRGPTFDRCESAYSSDDNLNIHGDFGRVVQRVDDRRYYMQGAYAAGDSLEFRDQDTVALLGTAKVVSVRESPDGPSLAINERYRAKGAFLLELDASLQLPALSLVVLDGKRSSRGWVIRNCWFHDNFQRSLINGSPGGLIENTTLQNVGMGIRIQFETWGPWMEGPFASDLVIRNCRFLDAPPGGPAIAVSMHPPGGGSNRRRFEATPVTNMTIVANYFGRTSATPVTIDNVNGLRIHGNSIDYAADTPIPAGPGNTFDVKWLFLQGCRNVSIQGNETPASRGRRAGGPQ